MTEMINTDNRAPGDTPALPSQEDIARNEREAKKAIGKKARWLVAQHVKHGRPIAPDDLKGFGKAGCAYFSGQLKAATQQQLAAETSDPKPIGEPAGHQHGKPLVVETTGWRALQRPRKHFSSRPRTGALSLPFAGGFSATCLPKTAAMRPSPLPSPALSPQRQPKTDFDHECVHTQYRI